jgi:hypothetical protein
MLKPDLYLKVVLTIIAVALLWVGFTLNTRPVQAQASAQRVIITGIELPGNSGVLPVGISATRWTGYTWSREPLNVAITEQPISVTIAKDKDDKNKDKEKPAEKSK